MRLPIWRKTPDGLTLLLWQIAKSLVWDVTIVCPLADSYVASAARELAASKKIDKYTSLAADYHFQPIAVEMLGPIFLLFWRRKLANVLDTSGRLLFYFSAFLFCCSDSTAFCFTIRCSWELSGVMVTPTFFMSVYFQIPRDTLYRGY